MARLASWLSWSRASASPTPPRRSRRRSSSSASHRVGARRAQVAPVEPLHPGALGALVRHQTHAHLVDGQRQRVVGEDRAVARLDAAVEQQALVDLLQLRHADRMHAGVRRRAEAVAQVGEHALAEGAPDARLLLDGGRHLRCEAAVECGQVLAGAPRREVEGGAQRLAKGGEKGVGIDAPHLGRRRLFQHAALRSRAGAPARPGARSPLAPGSAPAPEVRHPGAPPPRGRAVECSGFRRDWRGSGARATGRGPGAAGRGSWRAAARSARRRFSPRQVAGQTW